MTGRTALVSGATGLVGRDLVAQLLAAEGFDHVHVVARRAVATPADPRLSGHLADFERLGQVAEAFAVSHVFCALGTTIRVAGSRAAFRRVDHDYPLEVARLALAAGARHFLLVSALGADPGSRVFYSRVKGELEAAVTSLGYRSVTIARPSFLLGERDERRIGEAIGRRLGVLLPARYRPVHGSQVARALVSSALADRPGVAVLENRELRSAGRR